MKRRMAYDPRFSFRVLTMAEFNELTAEERLIYIGHAVDDLRTLNEQIAQTLGPKSHVH